MADPDGVSDGQGNNLNNAVWSFDISGAQSLSSITIDIAAMGNFESASMDGFTIEARVDGNAYQTIFQGITDESASMEYRPLDLGTVVNLDDPLELYIDGVATGIFLDKSDPITGLFDTFTSTGIAGQFGANLDIRIRWAGTTSLGEPIGFDNFTINGVAIPEPSGLVLLGLGLSTIACRRRRRR